MAALTVAFLIPGDVDMPTGGYAYDRAILSHFKALRIDAYLVTLPASFPFPTIDDIAATRTIIENLPTRHLLLIDGLAYGAFDDMLLVALKNHCVIALVHHPLCFETGIDESAANNLRQSEKAALDYAHHIVVTSEATKQTLIYDFCIEHEHITVAEPGVEAAPLAENRTSAKNILSVGSVIARKGYDVLIEALAGIKHLDWHLKIVGDTSRSTAIVEQLQLQIIANGLDNRVTLAGALQQPDVNSAYLDADIFVLSSHYEGYGMVITEALSRGLPVISTPTGIGLDTRYQDALTIVPCNSPHTLQNEILKMLTDDVYRNHMRMKSEACRLKLPTWEHTTSIIATSIIATSFTHKIN